MTTWNSARVKDVLMPELIGVATYGGGLIAAAAVDAALTKEGQPVSSIAQNTVTGASVVGSAVMIGYNKAPEFATGLLFGSGVGVVLTLLQIAYERFSKTPAPQRTKISHVGALIPQKVGAVKGLSGGRTTRFELGAGDLNLGNLGGGKVGAEMVSTRL